MEQKSLGHVLIVGGAGFVGSHVAEYFLGQPGVTSISVLSRNPQAYPIPGTSSHAVDITDRKSVLETIEKLKPDIIIHTACPEPTRSSTKMFREAIVDGTRNLLDAAIHTASVKVFVFTSSVTVYSGATHVNLDETAMTADQEVGSNPYARCKALADRMVLDANQPQETPNVKRLLTACLRMPLIYGERAAVGVPGALEVLRQGQTNVILGKGINHWDFAHISNVAKAHYTFTVALNNLFTSPKTATATATTTRAAAAQVDGQAFNITDGQSYNFWTDYMHTIWKTAGWVPPTSPPQTTYQPFKVPSPPLFFISSIIEWVSWLCAGKENITSFPNRSELEYVCFDHTYSIDKARRMLGYDPKVDFRRGLEENVKWALVNQGWGEKLAGCKALKKSKKKEA